MNEKEGGLTLGRYAVIKKILEKNIYIYTIYYKQICEV